MPGRQCGVKLSSPASGTLEPHRSHFAAPGADLVDDLARALQDVVGQIVTPGVTAEVLFSGGLDSSLLAHLLRKNTEVRLRTIGVPGARDLEVGRTASEELGLPWTGVLLGEEELARGWNDWGSGLRPEPEPRRSVLFSLGLAFPSAPGATLWIGQGADELFGGYAHFEGLAPTDAAVRARADMDRLRAVDWPATLALAAQEGVTLCAPYLASELVGLVERIPAELRFPAPGRKELLRRVARQLGLPASIVERPKRAMQYGSGVRAWVRRQTARPEGARSSIPRGV